MSVDQYLSAVIITIITGIFSIITIIIQRKQDKVIRKIDEQTTFIDREKTLKQKLAKKEKERDALIQQMMVLILDTNICILKNTNIVDESIAVDNIFATSDDLKKKFEAINDEIEEINDEYSLVLDLTTEFQQKIEKNKKH